MKLLSKTALTVAVVAGMIAAAQAQQVIGAGTYTENFDNIGSGLPSGWSVSSDATATTLGAQNATYVATATSWGDTSANFRNAASATGLLSTATVAQQAASTNRALGLRQSGSFADPGAAFNFNFSTSGVQVNSISIDLMMLSVQTRSTTFSIQYGVGANPSSFTTIGTWPDPGTFGTTSFTFNSANFGTDLNNQSNLYFRVVALTGSSGTGNRDTIGIDNFVINAAIPEPSVYMLLGVGLLFCGQRFLRRKRA